MTTRTPDDVRAVTSYDSLARWATECPDRPGIGCDGDWITFAEWHERVQQRAASLRGDVSPVALVYDAADGIEFAVGYVATHAARRPALVLNPRLPAHALRAQIDRAGAGTVLGRDDVAPSAEPRTTPMLDRWGDPIADVSFSSGTTGEPKGILLSHWGLAWAAVLSNELALAARTSSDQPGDPLGPDDTIVSAFQAGSAGTTIGFLNCGLLDGAGMHFLSKFDAPNFSSFMAKVGATVFYGAPAHFALWRQAEPDATPSARVYALIGQAIPCADARWFVERRGTSHLINGYGLTESCAGVLIAIDDEIAERPGAIGRPLGDVKVQLVDSEGAEGHLAMSSFGMMEGYLDRPDLTAEKMPDGWLLTGDIVEQVDDAFYIRGRIGDRINRGGYKFAPMEVEECAAAVTGVTGAVACGVHHPILGEDVVLAIEVASTRDLDDVLAAVRDALERELPAFKVPRDIRAVRQMPRAPLGKPQRTAVAAWFTETEVGTH